MSNKKLHIVCFDVPFPVSHGGFFDLFYKIKCLHKIGISLYIHCFQYGRDKQPELEHYASEVYYYKRKGLDSFSFIIPYIVSSRINNKLFDRLKKDNYAILLEGIHCSYLLYKDLFPDRNIILRQHNIESVYYQNLFKWEKSVLKKLYLLYESTLLKKYEKVVMTKATSVLTVSETDLTIIKKYNQSIKAEYVPLFLPFTTVRSILGKGSYLLYHGNLAISENLKAAFWLVRIFASLKFKLIIAGRNAPNLLKTRIEKLSNCELMNNPSDQELETLVQGAHINFVISFNDTGIKLKLLYALFMGRHCIANYKAISNPELIQFCHLANNETEIIEKVNSLFEIDFSNNDLNLRYKLLNYFDADKSAQQISALL